MQYEYKHYDVENFIKAMALANEMGKDGWRWVNSVSMPWTTMTMIFERVAA